MRSWFTILLCPLLLLACVAPPSPLERRHTADALAAAHGWIHTAIPGGQFELAAWLPPTPSDSDDADLTIYIEGDGLAWLAPDMPSSDPTPRLPLSLQLALAQPSGNAVYLARPCQYTEAAPACAQRYWLQGRFAPEVVDAMNQAVETLRQRFHARQLTLVGYSGGGAIAALVATRRTDVVRLVTVAGNLDHRAWTQYHRVPSLTDSLNPADERTAPGQIPQWHFVGNGDRTVPPTLVSAFAAGLPHARVITLEGYDHACCWAEHWSELWGRYLLQTAAP